jgi:hypothetical protein
MPGEEINAWPIFYIDRIFIGSYSYEYEKDLKENALAW